MENFDHLLGIALIALGVASAAVPLLRHLATLTANKSDDEAVEKFAQIVHDALSWIPTLRFAPSLDQKRTLKENGK